jgi:hypothetical protein
LATLELLAAATKLGRDPIEINRLAGLAAT